MLTPAEEQQLLTASEDELASLSVQVARQEAIGIPCTELVRKGYLITALIQALGNTRCLASSDKQTLLEYLKQSIL